MLMTGFEFRGIIGSIISVGVRSAAHFATVETRKSQRRKERVHTIITKTISQISGYKLFVSALLLFQTTVKS